MHYLLDTNAVITLLGQKSDALLNKVFERDEGEIGLSSIVCHELYFGAFKSKRVSFNLETLRLLFQDFSIVSFETEDARVSGEIRATLAASGMPIGSYDVLIAGQAKARDLTLITNNMREFERVADLRLQDWTL